MMIPSAKSLTADSEGAGVGRAQNLWIRTAAGPRIGFGHLKRCLILAEALRDCCVPLFLLDSDDCWSVEQLTNSGWSCCSQAPDQVWSSMPEPAGILIDTRLTAGLDRLMEIAKGCGIPVLSIHDLGLNPLPSDIVIDGSIAPARSGASPRSVAYQGTHYMVLDPVYGRLHRRRKRFRKRVGSIFVNLGGGDSERFFGKILEGLRLWSHEAEVIGVPGFTQWGQESLCRKDWTPLSFRWESRDIERLLFQADLAITAGGLSAYEALCSGTPLLSLSYDRLQQVTITTLAQKGACVDLGPGAELDPVKLSRVLPLIDSDLELRKNLSTRGRRIVDGRGAERVSQIIRQSIQSRSTAGLRRPSDASGTVV